MQFFNINLINIESAYADFKLYKIKKEKKKGGGHRCLRNTLEAREVVIDFIPSTEHYILYLYHASSFCYTRTHA